MTNLGTNVIFNNEAIDVLASRLETSKTSEDFFVEVDKIASDSKYLLELPAPIEFSKALDSNLKKDIESAITVFEGVGSLSPAAATDPRLWSYLALVTFREYMLKRWPFDDKRDWRATVSERMLLRRLSRRPLMRHGIARLWWVTFQTHDPNLEMTLSKKSMDPYVYTQWAIGNQNRIQSIFERQLGSDQKVLRAILEFLNSSNSALEANKKNESELIKAVAKELNGQSGFRQLDLLENGELEQILKLCVQKENSSSS